MQISPEALALIARAAEGSVRDLLSLLDQAIATSEGPVEADRVQAMLGLGDRLQLLELFEAVMRGDAAGALDRFGALYELGADPARLTQDLLEISHWLSRLKVAPDATSSLGIAAQAAERARTMAKALSLPVLARAWQMLLKGIDEGAYRTRAAAAAEMLLLRLACVSDLPSPAELARLLRQPDSAATTPAASPTPMPAPKPGRAPWQSAGAALQAAPAAPQLGRAAGAQPMPAAPPAGPQSFRELVTVLRDGGEAPLAAWLIRAPT